MLPARWARNGVAAFLVATFLASCLRTNEITVAISESYASVMKTPSRLLAEEPRQRKKPEYTSYLPSPIESYIIGHMEELNLTIKAPDLVPTCHLWTEPTTTPYHSEMINFVNDLKEYYKRVESFSLGVNVTDLRLHLDDPKADICDKVEIDGTGLPALFPNEKLSYTSAGWAEPLLPPMRHPAWCLDRDPNLMASIEYLIHDFGHLCRQLKRTSRIVLFDMGATLSFGAKKWPSPVLYLVRLFEKFGLPFDHIYAWELNRKDPNVLFKEELPANMDAAYHFINVGVSDDPASRQNPFKLLKENYNEDDIIIVKLDIDSPAIERKLVDQLMNDTQLLSIIDHFYFEHHVNQKELRPFWGAMEESVEESFTIFQELRRKGLAAHFWN